MQEVLSHIDAEIARLQQARALLTGIAAQPNKPGRGRPKGSKNASSEATSASSTAATTRGKRKLSPEGRKAIAEAMKRRWAERRKQPPK